MLKNGKGDLKKKLYKMRSQLIAKLGNFLMKVLIRTCHIHVEGLESFIHVAETEKCILMLWHNRLAIIPSILNRYAPTIIFAALVSGSRDGEILSTVVHSYKRGRTIKVSHQARHQALRQNIRHIEERKQIVIMTPDGPRGPCYEIKPGIAFAALETQAYVIPLDWAANRFWELKTWDRLRVPKPFTTIVFRFLPPFRFENRTQTSLEEATKMLKQCLTPTKET
jgi:lysophospholipid acyltransferase (LPLAT)-like uncharacterized protein